MSSGSLSWAQDGNIGGSLNIGSNVKLWSISFDSDNSWIGYSSYDGSSGQASKPATIACMWILRFI